MTGQTGSLPPRTAGIVSSCFPARNDRQVTSCQRALRHSQDDSDRSRYRRNRRRATRSSDMEAFTLLPLQIPLSDAAQSAGKRALYASHARFLLAESAAAFI